MCDDFTLEADKAALSRRKFGIMGGAAVVTAGYATAAEAGFSIAKGGAALTGRMVEIPTPDGICDAFFVHPAKGCLL